MFEEFWFQLLIGLAVTLTIGAISYAYSDVRERRERTQRRNGVVFVSHGGTCRDPMAMIVTKEALKAFPQSSITVSAAGTTVPPRRRHASPAAQIAVEHAYGTNLLASHRIQQISEKLVEDAGVILCMEKFHVDEVVKAYRSAEGKTKLLREFFGSTGEISNPWRMHDETDKASIDRYAACLQELRSVIEPNIRYLIDALKVWN